MMEEDTNSITASVLKMLEEQKKEWPAVGKRFAALRHIRVRSLTLSETCHIAVQFNPDRIRSSAADISPEALAKRPCFLCPAGRDPLQRTIPVGDYGVQVNPFPIFPEHFTVTYKIHTPQTIMKRFGEYLILLKKLEGLTVFYNGPHCGASAPDHLHFQACTQGILPVEREWSSCPMDIIKRIPDNGEESDSATCLLRVKNYFRTLFVLKGKAPQIIEKQFYLWLAEWPVREGEYEPRLNLIGFYSGGKYTVFLFPRNQLRPDCYYACDDSRRMVSPASVEMGGLFITPLEKDFNALSVAEAVGILDECTLKI